MTTCPDEPELLSVAAGEPTSDAIAQHVDGCELCSGRVERLRDELSMIPAITPDLGEGLTADPIGPDPADRQGEPPGGSTAPFPGVTTREFPGGPPQRPLAIGKYVVVDLLDSDGQADVYRVIDPELGRQLVLKWFRQPVEGYELGSFLDEGKALAELDHINLLRVYDSGRHDDRPFLVMEYVHGRNLEDYARDERVTPRRAAELVARLAGALALVHRKAIIHRDIKPRNILIDAAGEPRLIDFGLALLRNAWSDPFATTWGGTLSYMAPEQARREHDRIGRRSDLFGLGAVFFFLLTGRPPFVGETAEEILDRAQRGDFDAGALRIAKVPRRLERICLKALAADPADRYASAEAFEKALKRYLVRPKVVGVLSGVCGLAVLGSLVIAQAWPRPNPVPSQAAIPTAQPAPLAGELTLWVWSKDGGSKQGLKVDQPGALPLLPGEWVHVEARLNQPAHVYLLWLDSQGNLIQLCPRGDGQFGSRPSDGSPRQMVHSPEALDQGHKMSGPGGLETVLLLARRKPLSPGTDVVALFGPFPPSPLRDLREFAVRGFDEGEPVEALRMGQFRGIGNEPDRIDDPLIQVMERLKAENQFAMIKAVRFAYRGE
jgi:hypothetical protein